MNILMVADHAHAAEQIRAAFATAEHEVFHVSTPKRALAILDDPGEYGTYDLVVADNDMQPEGGFSLSREIKMRKLGGTQVPPIILLLARPQDEWLANWSQCDAWALKPTSPLDLGELGDAVMAGKAIPDLPGIGSNPQPLAIEPGYRPEYERQLASRGWVPEHLEDAMLPVGVPKDAVLPTGSTPAKELG